MKKILFVMDSLGAGGAEKSLITLLNNLPQDKYYIELILIRNEGFFLSQLPKNIKILEDIYPLHFLGISPKNIIFYIRHGISFFFKKLIRFQKAKRNHKGLSTPQALWQLWKNDIKILNNKYDIAISYLEGITNYYVIDKVCAEKKILWIHNEYSKLGYSSTFDSKYFQKANHIITISDICKQNLINNFPNINKKKFTVLENITDANLIKKLAKEPINNPIFTQAKGIKLLSVGRLAPQKAYDLALKAASILKQKNIEFTWVIIGEGPLRKELEQLKETLSLNENIFFIGLQINPYKWMDNADIIIQSSKFEGKSIAIDEAKILCKPIVSTNYNTINDLIQNENNGIITEMTPESLSNGILRLINNTELRKKLTYNLFKETNNNMSELKKYINIIEGENYL